jgi:hypothetical protein
MCDSRCDRCKFAKSKTVDIDDEDSIVYRCHRFPPSFIGQFNNEELLGVSNWDWPVVYDYESCGEFVEA